MDALTLADLITPDPRTLPFGPYGLGGALPAELAVEFQQSSVGQVQLASNVGEQTHRSFERLKTLQVYGVLCYDLFTMVESSTSLTLDLALAERFLDFYRGTAPFVISKGPDKGASRPLSYGSWDDVHAALRRGGSHAGDGFHLKPESGARPFRFTGLFESLLAWARSERLLVGQRNRRLEPFQASHRNRVAHPRYTHTVMPVDSARAINQAAEVVNQLWGHRTPGGRLYPAPPERRIVVVGWGPEGRVTWFELPVLEYADLTETTFIAVRSAYPDDARYFTSETETTAFPTELLWGPGDESELRAWALDTPTASDTVDYLDRYFLIRVVNETVDAARRPAVAAGLKGVERDGCWHLVLADFPLDAVGHVKQLTAQALAANERLCAKHGPCPNCAAESLGSGKLDSMVHCLRSLGVSVKAERPPSGSVPSFFGAA